MQLRPVDSPDLLRLVAGWLSRKENYQWLDFGDGRQTVSPEWLKLATQRGTLVLRIFTADDDETPIGAGGLSSINPHFRTATLWVVVGDKTHAGRGYGTRATSRMLTLGFTELGLHSINTWCVEHNPSVRIAERLKMNVVGRLRQCHRIDGLPYDRVWFDMLASEHKELSDASGS